eukprot:TRINITY_DN3394_c0_g2_i1.p1 TRINITY_DN3394_c0_g2~~TRINITY_DN3394_c0_g2_i1.p1  ORF type:complete len:175 (+),score=21.36 TRINITY_DN3394_c0_g2_i1:170-694(+)
MALNAAPKIISQYIKAQGHFPNSEATGYPLLIYKSAFASNDGDLASSMERTFSSNEVSPQWRYGMYQQAHYHSTTHEILGVFKGTASLRFGGEGEHAVHLDVEPGDVIIIPAGVAHQKLSADSTFCMVGAYPSGSKQWDMNEGKSNEEKASALKEITKIQPMRFDPLFGRWTAV